MLITYYYDDLQIVGFLAIYLTLFKLIPRKKHNSIRTFERFEQFHQYSI